MSHIDYHLIFFYFFFNPPATTYIYTLSLHDALPILFSLIQNAQNIGYLIPVEEIRLFLADITDGIYDGDRKSTRLNSSHITISYAVFCLKKKKKKNNNT